MKTTNGHRSQAAFNVYVWISNDPTLYGAAMAALKQGEAYRASLTSNFLKRRPVYYYAAPILLRLLPNRTPDHKTRYTVLNLREALKAIAGA